jgi:hypothetical protein
MSLDNLKFSQVLIPKNGFKKVRVKYELGMSLTNCINDTATGKNEFRHFKDL